MRKIPDLTPVQSSMASHAHYDPERQELHVKMKNGTVYRYDGVPVDKGHTVMGAASFGKSLNDHILGNHPSTKLS